MTWHRGDSRSTDPVERRNRLTCDGDDGWYATGKGPLSVERRICTEEITFVATADWARLKAREAGWQTRGKPTGDRCPKHKIGSRRHGWSRR